MENFDLEMIKGHKAFKGANPKHRDSFLKLYGQGKTPYSLFEEFTLKAIKTGRDKYGAKAIAELVRWHTWKSEKKGKVQNSHITMYARMFCYNHPEYSDFFSFRENNG